MTIGKNIFTSPPQFPKYSHAIQESIKNIPLLREKVRRWKINGREKARRGKISGKYKVLHLEA